MSIASHLPDEILLSVIADCGTQPLASLSRTCRRLYHIANPLLYKSTFRHVSSRKDGSLKVHSWVVNWAAAQGKLETLKKVVKYGAAVATVWLCDDPVLFPVPVGYWQRCRAVDETVWRLDFKPKRAFRPNSMAVFNALHLAVVGGHDEVVAWLLDLDPEELLPMVANRLCNCNVHSNGRGLSLELNPKPGRPSFSWSDTIYWSPLYLAICHGHASTVRLLVMKQASVTRTENEGLCITAVHTAAACGLTSILGFLVLANCPIDAQDRDGSTALNHATEMLDSDAIEELLRLGAKIDAGNNPPLCDALDHLNYDAALKLIEAGANTKISHDGLTPLHRISTRPTWKQKRPWYTDNWRLVLSKLLETGADINARITGWTSPPSSDRTPLMAAARDPVGNLKVMRALIDAGADVRARGLVETALGNVTRYFVENPDEIDDAFAPIHLLVSHGANPRRCRRTFDLIFDIVLERAAATCSQAQGHASPFLDSVQSLPGRHKAPWSWLDDATCRFLMRPAIELCQCQELHFAERLIAQATAPIDPSVLSEAMKRCFSRHSPATSKALARCGMTLYLGWQDFKEHGDIRAFVGLLEKDERLALISARRIEFGGDRLRRLLETMNQWATEDPKPQVADVETDSKRPALPQALDDSSDSDTEPPVYGG